MLNWKITPVKTHMRAQTPLSMTKTTHHESHMGVSRVPIMRIWSLSFFSFSVTRLLHWI